MPLQTRSCPTCSRVLSTQGLPNHMRFMHRQTPTLASVSDVASPSAERGGSGLAMVLAVVAVGVVLWLVVTYTLARCTACGRLSVVPREPKATVCPKCQAALS